MIPITESLYTTFKYKLENPTVAEPTPDELKFHRQNLAKTIQEKPLQFSSELVSYKAFPASKGWLARKFRAIPLSFNAILFKTVYHLAQAIFHTFQATHLTLFAKKEGDWI